MYMYMQPCSGRAAVAMVGGQQQQLRPCWVGAQRCLGCRARRDARRHKPEPPPEAHGVWRQGVAHRAVVGLMARGGGYGKRQARLVHAGNKYIYHNRDCCVIGLLRRLPTQPPTPNHTPIPTWQRDARHGGGVRGEARQGVLGQPAAQPPAVVGRQEAQVVDEEVVAGGAAQGAGGWGGPTGCRSARRFGGS